MAHITSRDAISIALIAAYVPLLLLSVFLLFRHGLRRGTTWLFILLLSLLRLIGASLSLATISNPHSLSLYIGAATCSSIGVSPLYLAAASIINQVIYDANRNPDNKRRLPDLALQLPTRIIEALAVIAVVLAVIGGIRAGKDYKHTGEFTPQPLTQAAAALFIVVYVALLAMAVLASRNAQRRMLGPKLPPLLVAVWVSLPLLLVRLVYSCASAFGSGNSKFNIVTGDVWYWLGMAVVEEILVVALYVSAGIATPPSRD